MIVIYTHGEWITLQDNDDSDVEVIAIVPMSDVLLTTADLPKLNHQRLMLALPFALEEQLLDDVSQLHFAISDSRTEDLLPVAVVSHQKMQTWLQSLTDAGITPTLMIPTSFALPFVPNQWHISVDNETATLRTGEYSGVACEKSNLQAFLTLKLAEAEKQPEYIHFYNLSGQPLNLTFSNIIVNEISMAEKPFLEDMAGWARSAPVINLLQGAYQPKSTLTQTKKIWQAAGGLAVIWMVLAMFSHSVSFILLHRENQQVEQAINKIYMRHFPAATHIVEPRARLEAELKQLRGQTEKNAFFNLLGITGEKLSKSPNIHLQSLDFRERQLNLAVTTDTFNTLDAFTHTLTQEGLRVAQKNAGIVDKEVKANLFIEAGTK